MEIIAFGTSNGRKIGNYVNKKNKAMIEEGEYEWKKHNLYFLASQEYVFTQVE